jgi:hypothetical protein
MAAWQRERRLDPVTHARTVVPVTTPSAQAVTIIGARSAPAAAPAADRGNIRATEAASGIAS